MILVYDLKKNCWKQSKRRTCTTDRIEKQWHWAGTPICKNSLIALPLTTNAISERIYG
jgi:hypothetical protein